MLPAPEINNQPGRADGVMNSAPVIRTPRELPKPSAAVTLQFAGLMAFTTLVVTSRWSGAEYAIAFAMIGLFVGIQGARFPTPFWWGISLVAWAYLTSFFAMSPDLAQATALGRLKVMLIFLVVMNALRTEKQLLIFLLVIVGSFIVYPARGALLNYIHGDTLFGRTVWNMIYSNPNDLASIALLTMGAALSVASGTEQKAIIRLGCAASAGIILLVTLLTQSRGGFLGLLVGFGPPFIKRFFKRPIVPICATIAVAVGIAILPDSLWVRLSGMTKLTSTATIAQADPEGSAAQRWQIQQTAWRIFEDHPLMGVGLGCYPLANRRYAPELGDRDTHDTYLNLAAELGIPGLIMWLGLVGSVLLHVRRLKSRKPPTGSLISMVWLQCGLVAFLVAGIFGSYSGITMGYLILGALWVGAGLCRPGRVNRTSQSMPGNISLRKG